MSLHDQIAADAAQIFAEFGKEITLAGQTLSALISEPEEFRPPRQKRHPRSPKLKQPTFWEK